MGQGELAHIFEMILGLRHELQHGQAPRLPGSSCVRRTLEIDIYLSMLLPERHGISNSYCHLVGSLGPGDEWGTPCHLQEFDAVESTLLSCRGFRMPS